MIHRFDPNIVYIRLTFFIFYSMFQVFAYRYMDTEKFFVNQIKMYKDLDELLADIREEERLQTK